MVRKIIYSRIIIGIVCVSLISECQSAPSDSEVVFYEDAQYNGDRLFLKLGKGCYTMERDWDNRISSVKMRGNCIMAYDKPGCRGTSIKLTTGALGTGDLRRVRFNNALSSLSVCSRANGGIPSFSVDSSNFKGAPEFWRVGLEEHNRYRRLHGVPPLKIDRLLNNDAQNHADYLAKNNRFEVSRFTNYGENLATSYEKNELAVVRDAIQRWYAKIEQYDFRDPETNKNRPKSGQFSSIVWKSTTHMGIGVARNHWENKWIVVVFYDPAATTSRYRENVYPVIRAVQTQEPAILQTSPLGNLYAYF